MVGKVGSGYSVNQLRTLTKDRKWHKYDNNRRPLCFGDWIPGSKDDIPGGWMKPCDAVIFELKCFELTACKKSKFNAGVTLRFPRVSRIRDDKPWNEGMTLTDVLMMYQRQQSGEGRSAKNVALERGWETKQQKGKKRKHKQVKQPMSIIGQGKANVEQTSDLLAGRSFCVLSCRGLKFSKADITDLIAENGGKTILTNQLRFAKTLPTLLTSQHKAQDAKLYAKTGKYDILHLNWLLESVAASKLLPTSTKYVVHLTADTKASISSTMDDFGDSYIEDATLQSLKEVLNQPGLDTDTLASRQELFMEFDHAEQEELLTDYDLFARCNVFVALGSGPEQEHTRSMLRSLIRLHHGQVSQKLMASTTHVICTPAELKQVDTLSSKLRKKQPRLHFAKHYCSPAWVHDSISGGFRAAEDAYKVILPYRS
jgi:DNA ligase-4